MKVQDLYVVLGVDRGATHDELKRAYRREARLCHPDYYSNNPEKTERFKQISFAYGVLSDPNKRYRYNLGQNPISSLQDLFSVHTDGLRVLESMFDVGSSAPKRGVDIVMVMDVPKSLQNGTEQVSITLPDISEQPEETIVVDLPVKWRERPWAHIPRLGGVGKNGAEPGDLFLVLNPV